MSIAVAEERLGAVTTAFGIVALVLGLLIVLGQLISVVNFPLAQRLGLQEKDEGTDLLHRHLELNTARWDLAVLWTLVLAGVVMLADASWWPWAVLIAGGISIDTGGREIAKILGLRAEGIRVGSADEVNLLFGFLALISAVGTALVGYSLAVLA